MRRPGRARHHLQTQALGKQATPAEGFKVLKTTLQVMRLPGSMATRHPAAWLYIGLHGRCRTEAVPDLTVSAKAAIYAQERGRSCGWSARPTSPAGSSRKLDAEVAVRPKLLWLSPRVPAAEVACRAGHGVAVMLKICAHRIDGQATAASQRIVEALGI